MTLKCECVTLSEGVGFRPFTVTSYPYHSKQSGPTGLLAFATEGRVAVSPIQSTELQGIQRTSRITHEHTSFRRRKEKEIYKTTRSVERQCGIHGSQFQRLRRFYMCTKRHQPVCLKQCFLRNSENVPQFALFSHLSSIHISLTTKSKICLTTKALSHCLVVCITPMRDPCPW